MQGAGLEENDDLQDRWAALLVNAANANFRSEVRRSYAVILEQLTPLDAHILDVLYSLPFEKSQHDGIATAELPLRARVKEGKEQELPPPSEEVIISLSNLTRLGCLRPGMTWGGGESLVELTLRLLVRLSSKLVPVWNLAYQLKKCWRERGRREI